MCYKHKQYGKHFFAFAKRTRAFKIEDRDARFNSAQIINKNRCTIIYYRRYPPSFASENDNDNNV